VNTSNNIRRISFKNIKIIHFTFLHYMSGQEPHLYFPPEIWDKILNIVNVNDKIQCINCDIELCRSCMNDNKFNTHSICEVCKDIVCKNIRTFVYCNICNSTIHYNCSLGLKSTIPAENVTIFKTGCIDCINTYKNEIQLKYGEDNVRTDEIILMDK